MNNGRYSDRVVNEAVRRMRRGAAKQDVIDIFKEKYDYEKLSLRTLDRWQKNFPLGKSRPAIPKGMEATLLGLARQGAESIEFERSLRARKEAHWTALIDSLDDLRGVEPFPLRDFGLATWVSRPTEPRWPMANGFMRRGSRGHVAVRLRFEERGEFRHLNQHLPQDPLWASLRTWKQIMEKDIRRRMSSVHRVIGNIEKSVPRGGLGIPVLPNLGFGGTQEPAVDLFFAFSIYDRALSMALGLNSVPHAEDAFSQSSPDVVELEGRPAISAKDPGQIIKIKSFFYDAVFVWAQRPETLAVAATYLQAEEQTEALNAHRERLQDSALVLPNTICSECKPWAAIVGMGTP